MSVKGASCSYVPLKDYNSTTPGSLGSPAVPSATVSGYYVVPNYAAIGYSALTHDASSPSCSGYFNIQDAYGANAAQCNTQYSQSPCNQ